LNNQINNLLLGLSAKNYVYAGKRKTLTYKEEADHL